VDDTNASDRLYLSRKPIGEAIETAHEIYGEDVDVRAVDYVPGFGPRLMIVTPVDSREPDGGTGPTRR
jgi:hypothetical protein